MVPPVALRHFRFFAGLEREIVNAIATLGKEASYQEGDWLFRQDETAEALFLVLDGSVELMMDMDGLGEHHEWVDIRRAGEVIGWSALVPPHKYTLSGLAASDAKLVRLDGPKLRDVLDANPAASYRLMYNLAQVIGDRLTSMRVRFVSLIED